jgi:cytochrome c-type biogenesis protein CcmH
MRIILSLFLFGCLALPAHAAIEAYEFKDKATEQEYHTLIKELRCLVCQNNNLADSNADLAKDLRQQTYEMLQQGKNRQQIVEYMVDRYGDFVLYNPPVKSDTVLLWFGPFALLLLVLIMVIVKVRKTRSVEAPEAQKLDQARDLLSDHSEESGESK